MIVGWRHLISNTDRAAARLDGASRLKRLMAVAAIAAICSACSPPPIQRSFAGDGDALVLHLMGPCLTPYGYERSCDPEGMRQAAPENCTPVGDGFACRASVSSQTSVMSRETGEPIISRDFTHREMLFAASGASCSLLASTFIRDGRVDGWQVSIRHGRADGSKAQTESIRADSLSLSDDTAKVAQRWLFEESESLSKACFAQ